jgi:hypothetical protein
VDGIKNQRRTSFDGEANAGARNKEGVMAGKRFRLRAEEIKLFVQSLGGCFASAMIPVEGQKVGYMYREKPNFDADSGWRFLAGVESKEYLDDPENLAIYDINTIANYDPEIIPFLHASIGSAFERDSVSGKFVEVKNG